MFLTMSNREDIIKNIINKTQKLIENKIGFELNNNIMNSIYILLDKEYLEESLTYDEKLFNSGCWGGGVWDFIYNYDDDYKYILVLNYQEIEDNSRLSPVNREFPHKELNQLCIKEFKKIY